MWGEDVRIRPLTSLSHSGSQPTDKKSCQAGGGYLERYRPALKFMTMTMFSAATPIKDHAALAPPTDQAEASKIIESNASKVRPTRSPRVWLMGEICEREAAPSPRVVVEVDYVSDAVMGLIMTTDVLALVPAAQRACDSLSTGMSDSSGEDYSLRNSAPRIPTVEGYDGDLTMFSSAKYYMDSYARDSILLGQRRLQILAHSHGILDLASRDIPVSCSARWEIRSRAISRPRDTTRPAGPSPAATVSLRR